MATVVENIENERKKLLDLTLRNRLLNYRPTKARTIRILNTNAQDIYDVLVIEEKPLQFRATKPAIPPATTSLQQQKIPENQTANTEVPAPESIVWTSPRNSTNEEKTQKIRYLDTPFDPETLARRLLIDAQESKSILDEQGYTVLYLALGFLEWYDPSSPDKSSRAPLVLIPVELRREEVRDVFKIQWTTAEILTNISLKEKLRETGVILPDFEMPEDKSGIDDYFALVKQAISRKDKWTIFSDSYLDFFSFTKFVMFKDLDLSTWPAELNPVNHPVIKAIFNPDPSVALIPGFNEEEVDRKIRADSVYHILDADSSQIAVVEDVKAGRNLVVQGPPGTGKSQTIANAIADLLAQGKTVLFISEKMAALEVVKKRLDQVGVGDFCLELHSKKATIKSVHQKIQRTLLQRTLYLNQIRDPSTQDQFDHYETLKGELNAYIQILNTPVGQRQLSPYILFGLSEKTRKHFTGYSRKPILFSLSDPENVTEQDWQKSLDALKKVVGVLPRVSPVQRNPWYGCNPGVILPSDIPIIETKIQDTKHAFFELQNKMVALSELTGLSLPDNIHELVNAIGSTKLFVSPNPIDRNLLLNDAWNQPNRQVDQVIDQIDAFQQMEEEILRRFSNRILGENLDQFLKEFTPLANQFFILKLINSRYRTLRQQAFSYYLDQKQHTDAEIINDLTHILKCITIREQIRQSGDFGRSLFGSLWVDDKSDTRQLRAFSSWIIQFRKKMLEDVFTVRTVEMMSRGVSVQAIARGTEEVTQAWQRFIQCRYELYEILHFDTEHRFLQNDEQLEFSKYQLLITNWEKSLPRLIDWSHYANFSEDCQSTYAGQILNSIEEQDIPPEDVIPAFEGSYADGLIRIALKKYPELSRFLGDTHEEKIRAFAELDRKLIEQNRYRLIWKMYKDMPDIEAEASLGSLLGILKKQFDLKRGKLPIRQFIKTTADMVLKVNPCFMMSPLSVAQFLDPRAIRFDVIIFDEASQVRPEDALGALLRGDQAVVIGDSRQLPPTSFFDRMVEDELEDFDDPAALPSQMESILNLCRISFPSKTLRWHYRSRHESLIALSNAEFYDNRLFVYPSPMHQVKDIGLKFVHLPNTVYGRGSSQTNPEEALAVARAVFDHYTRYPNKSLGVGTFNIKQQQAILDAVETLRRERPEMERYFHEDNPEKFFVKNLETIQGDERDVIFISVGFGKDSNGVLRKNFGPLNQEGGERRLNVLITRARERCVVFSNFTANDLAVDGASPFGVRVLKQFLSYAQNGNLPSTTVTGGDSESPFEDAVYDFLVANNHRVEKQIGCAGFRIDMAVVDSREPGCYLVGIECDGAQYHSSKVARDRDRLRQQVLEGLGWKIHRVWSTDWYRNAPDTKRRLLEAIEKIKIVPQEQNSDPIHAKQPSPEIRIQKPARPVQNISSQVVKHQESNAIPEYRFCTNEDLGYFVDFSTSSFSTLESAVIEIVSIESPIHLEELFLRIKKAGNIPKLTSKIKERIRYACHSAITHGNMRIDDEFLWSLDPPAHLLRRRSPDQGTEISWICPEEIRAGIEHVLTRQYATEMEDLIVQVLRIFGFLRVSDQARDVVRDVVKKMIDKGELVMLPDGMVDLKK